LPGISSGSYDVLLWECYSKSSALTAIGEVRRTLDQILARGRNIEHMLTEQWSVLNDAHRKIHAVTENGLLPLRN